MSFLVTFVEIAQGSHLSFTMRRSHSLLRSNTVSVAECVLGGSLELTASIAVIADKAIQNLLPMYT